MQSFPTAAIAFLLTVVSLGQVINICMMKGETCPSSLWPWCHKLVLNYRIKSTIPLETIGWWFPSSSRSDELYTAFQSVIESEKDTVCEGDQLQSVKDIVTSVPNALVKSPLNSVYRIDCPFQKGHPYGRRMRELLLYYGKALRTKHVP